MLEAKNQMGVLILLFITIIIGVNLFSAMSENLYVATNTQSANDTIDTSLGKSSVESNYSIPYELSLSEDNLASFDSLTWWNGTVFTKDVDYRVNLTEGGLTMLDTDTTHSFNESSDNNTYAVYTFKGDEYVDDSVSRTILNHLISIFFVVGLVIFVYAVVKKTWLDDMM
jgi:hypothetical protein